MTTGSFYVISHRGHGAKQNIFYYEKTRIYTKENETNAVDFIAGGNIIHRRAVGCYRMIEMLLLCPKD
jgi:hypothetical protein